MIQAFKSEFSRVAAFVGAGFVSMKKSELEDFCQSYNFDVPLINFEPLQDYASRIGHSGQIIYEGRCKIQIITKMIKSDNFETVKDEKIDGIILMADEFYRKLDRNENRVFISPYWKWENRILRQFTSNFLAGVEASITFDTACNRVEKQPLDLSINDYVADDYVNNYFL